MGEVDEEKSEPRYMPYLLANLGQGKGHRCFQYLEKNCEVLKTITYC